MRILVTGATGFIGRHVMPLLHGHDYMGVGSNPRFYEIYKFDPEIVIHLGWPGVYGDHRYDWHTQSDGWEFTRRLWQSTTSSCKRWVGVGSQAEISQPHVAYSQYKSLVHHEIADFCARCNTSFAWARLFSVYGPGEERDSFLPYLIRELLAGRNVKLTSQNIPWDFLHVEDAARALVTLALHPEAQGVFDIANGTTFYTADAACIVRDMIAPNAELCFGARPKRAIEIDSIPAPDVWGMQSLGWLPQVPFKDGIMSLVASIQSEDLI